jgi:hypothetical protein
LTINHLYDPMRAVQEAHLRASRKETEMIKIAVFALIAAALVATGTPALATCGGHCQQMKVCASQVGAKHLPKDQQHGEYNKCMTDPHSYK